MDLIFIVLMVGLSLTGLVSYERLTSFYYRSNLLPASAMLDVFMVLYVVSLLAKRIPLKTLVILSLTILYFLLQVIFLPPSLDGAPTLTDIIVAFKPFIYLIILCLARPHRGSIRLVTLENVFKIVLLALVLKYLMAKIFFGIPRPGLFTENNFELALPLVLFVFLSRRGRLDSNLWMFLIILLVLVSGSRSGLLALVAALVTSGQKVSSRLLMLVIVVPVLLAGALTLLNNRIADLTDIEQLDRFIFMILFFEEMQRFDLWNYVIGWAPMTPLSSATCNQLSFYTSLFSDGNPYICYPVILHVFYFRAILEHGFLGLIFIVIGFYSILRSNGFSRSLTIALLLQGMINGLSISGFGNTYFALALVLVISNYPGSQLTPVKGTKCFKH